MGEPAAKTPNSIPDAEQRLDSWKEIAKHLNRDITTVQRWEKREGMPVHRHLHDKKGSVYAFRAELDAWVRSRNPTLDEKNSQTAAQQLPSNPTTFGRRRLLLAGILLAAIAVAVLGGWVVKSDFFWRNPLEGARYQQVTDWDGNEQAAAISRDGRFIAFLSNRDGHNDVWITETGSGRFRNLTQGKAPELVNPSVRTLGFSPDGSLVTFWGRSRGPDQNEIKVWAVPVVGGELRSYLEGAAEYDWSRDGQMLAYHTPGPGDPLFISKGEVDLTSRPIFTASAGLHSHFPVWSPDGKFLYTVQGTLPDKLDIWRIPVHGGPAKRITTHNAQVSHPVFMNSHTLLYLAGESDGSASSLYSIDMGRGTEHRLTTGVEKYKSLAASSDGRRWVVTVAKNKRSLWRLPVAQLSAESKSNPVPLDTGTAYAPRFGPNYVVFISIDSGNERLVKLENGAPVELWRAPEAHFIGAPAISPDGKHIAFSVRQHGRPLLYLINADGKSPRIVADSLDLIGDPAWSPDKQFITTAATDHNTPKLFRVPLNGGSVSQVVDQYALSPVWAPSGFVLFSGPDVGTTFSLNAVNADGSAHTLPVLSLTRGARHVAFLPDGQNLLVLRGEIHHKDIWAINLETGAERRVTFLPADFDVLDFDVSPDARELVLERAQDRSDVVLFDLAQD